MEGFVDVLLTTNWLGVGSGGTHQTSSDLFEGEGKIIFLDSRG